MHPAYAHHKPGPRALKEMAAIRAKFAELHEAIEELTGGPSREKSLALTHLEESAMWLNKAIVKADPQSVPEA